MCKPSGAEHARLIESIARHGDQAAFELLFNDFAPRIKAWLRRQGCEASIAEDLAQDTMFVVWQKAALFDIARASPSTWIFRIARNQRIDALRRERHPSELLPEFIFATAPETQPDEIVQRDDDAARVRAAIHGLPEAQAAVVQESYFAGKPQTEIGDSLNLPLGTVKSRLRLAMARLRSALQDPQ